MSENICRSCALCCSDVNFTIANEAREKHFPDAIEVNDRLELEAASQSSNGVFVYNYASQGSELELSEIVINDMCPKYNNGCTIYEDRPKECRKFRRGGRACNDLRIESGLPQMDDVEYFEDDDNIY